MQATTTSPRERSLSRWLLTATVLVGVLLSLGTAGISAQEANPNGLPYIIVFKDTVNPHAAAPEFAKAYGLQPGFIYEYALKGMSAVVPEGRLIALQHDPRVAYVSEDLVRSINAQEMPTGIQRIFADTNPEIAINGADDYRVDVDVAVIDTGVDFQHPDLNVAGGVNCYNWWPFSASCKAGGDDDHYHGTHVAGTIGALDNGIGVVGVAPGARIWAVKVLSSSGSGYSSQIVAGIDWVAANAATIEVANMSLGGSGFSQAEYDAIQGAVNKGVAFAVAAGNDDADANNYSPGGFDNVLSVSALADFNGLPGGGAASTCRTDQDDTLADFSNWGPEIDVAAPGVCILSTYPLEQGEYGTISGTSMASPHAAGALALLASVNNPNNATDVYNLYNQVKAAGNYNWTDDSGDGIQEPLLDVSNTAIFNPVLVPGTGGTPAGCPDQPDGDRRLEQPDQPDLDRQRQHRAGLQDRTLHRSRLQRLRPDRHGGRQRDQLQQHRPHRIHQLQLPRAGLQRGRRFGLFQHGQRGDTSSPGASHRAFQPDRYGRLQEPDQPVLDG